jgi:hypothetical protein
MTRADVAFGNTHSRARGAGKPTRVSSPLRRVSAGVRALVTFALVAGSSSALCYNEERARAYFARELAECGAWYALVAEAPGLDEIIRIQFRAVGISLVSTAADIATEPWARTQTDLAAATIRREMGNSWKNFSVVDRKYGQHCRDVATNPVARRKYWLDKYE